MSQDFEVESPIINSPFREPELHWVIEKGKPPAKAEGRRRASYFYRVPEHAGRGRKKKATRDLFEAEKGEEVELAIVNEIRTRIKNWRKGIHSAGLAYDGASTVTKELLELWRGEDRMQRLFFAQIESVETILFLVEASEIYKKGLPEIPKDEPGLDTKAAGFRAFVRYACKMATGTGKTTVMGMLAAWSTLGRSPHWLVFNDEAHHAYRRGEVTGEEQSLDEDKDLARKNDREATIWIEGLDRINKLAGGSRKRGINLCVDLSATPFHIQGSGNEVGKPSRGSCRISGCSMRSNPVWSRFRNYPRGMSPGPMERLTSMSGAG